METSWIPFVILVASKMMHTNPKSKSETTKRVSGFVGLTAECAIEIAALGAAAVFDRELEPDRPAPIVWRLRFLPLARLSVCIEKQEHKRNSKQWF